MIQKINFKELCERLRDPWVPQEVSQVDGTSLRIARIEGEYRWHTHPQEDEFFFVLQGEITIETEKGNITLKEGEGALVPKGLRHRSKAEKPAYVLLIEPTRTVTTGVF